MNAGTTAAPRTLRTWWEQHGGLFAFLSIVVAVLSLLATLGVGVAQVLMDSGPATPQEHIAACDKTHGAPGKTQISGPSNEDPTASGPQVSVFTSCTWPQASGVADDGRYQIRVTTVLLPEELRISNGFDYMHVAHGPCRTYLIRYKESKGGFARLLEPVTLDPGQLVTFEGDVQNYGRFEELLPPDFLQGLTVLVPAGLELAEASCASL